MLYVLIAGDGGVMDANFTCVFPVCLRAGQVGRSALFGLPTEAALAHVLVAKYADHIPLYRQAQILARSGVELDRSTLAGWVGKAAFHLGPIVKRMADELKRGVRLVMDQTPAPVLAPGRGKTKTGYLWALAREDRRWGGAAPPAVVYGYAPGRGAEHAERLLRGFSVSASNPNTERCS